MRGSSPSRLVAVLWQLMDSGLQKTSSGAPRGSSSLHHQEGYRTWGNPFIFLALDPSHQRPSQEEGLEIAPAVTLRGGQWARLRALALTPFLPIHPTPDCCPDLPPGWAGEEVQGCAGLS